MDTAGFELSQTIRELNPGIRATSLNRASCWVSSCVREVRSPKRKGVPLNGGCLPLLEALVCKIISHRDWYLNEVVGLWEPKLEVYCSLLDHFWCSQLIWAPLKMLPCRLKDHVECPCEDCFNQGSTGEAVELVGTKCTDTHTHGIDLLCGGDWISRLEIQRPAVRKGPGGADWTPQTPTKARGPRQRSGGRTQGKGEQVQARVVWTLWAQGRLHPPVLCLVQLFATPWTIPRQASLSWELARQEYWNGLSCPPSRGSSQPLYPNQVSYIADRFFTAWATRKSS